MKYVLKVLIPIVLLGFIVACEEDDKIESRVVTEQILFIGSDKVRMSGRILSISNDGIQDHGHVAIAEDRGTRVPPAAREVAGERLDDDLFPVV